MIFLKFLGGVGNGDPDALTGKAAQRHPLALLSLLAAAQPRSLGRDKLIAYLWPEKDTASARNLLNQAVHSLRRALGPEAIASLGNDLALDPAPVSTDIGRFEQASAVGNHSSVVDLYGGPFLDGFFLGGSAEFERWVDGERERLRRAYLKSLEGLANWEEERASPLKAAECWRRLAGEDPYNSRVAMRFMVSLESVGDRAGALRHAAEHVARLEEDLGAKPDPEVTSLAERMRRAPAEAAGLAALGVAGNASRHSPGGASSRDSLAPNGARKRVALGGFVLSMVSIVGMIAITGLGRSADPPPTGNPDAYQLYLSAEALLEGPETGPGVGELAELWLRQAVQHDSTFALGWAALANHLSGAVKGVSALAGTIHRRPEPADAGRLTADSALRMAVAYGPDLPETVAAEGWYLFNVERDREAALRHFEVARGEYPNDPEFPGVMGLILISQGEWDDGLTYLEIAHQLDPDSYWRAALLGQMYAHSRRYDDAERLFDRATQAAPTHAESYIGKAIVLLKRDGDVRGARRVLAEARADVDEATLVFRFAQVIARRPYVRILNGLFDAWLGDSSVARDVRALGNGTVYWLLQAELAEQRGEADRARAYADSAVNTMPRLRILASAGVGRNPEADQFAAELVAEGPSLLSEAVSGYHKLEWLAEVQVRIGDLNGAIVTLELLLSHPGLLSAPVLELDPFWDPLREHPAFRKLMREYRNAGQEHLVVRDLHVRRTVNSSVG